VLDKSDMFNETLKISHEMHINKRSANFSVQAYINISEMKSFVLC